MRLLRWCRELHWPHLGLLAGLPLWWWWATTHTLSPTTTLFVWLSISATVLALAEHWRPFRRDWRPSAAQLRRDGTVFAMNALADGGVTALLTTVAVAVNPGDSDWSLPLQIGAGLLVSEFGSYWMHRLSHGGNWWWRVHLLHHRPAQVNVANAVLAHPLNAIYDKLVRVAPLLLLGLDDAALIAVALFALTQSLAVHANVAGHLGPLDYIVGSAGLHRLHHSTREDDTGNFGTALPIWDQVFSTYRRGASPAEVGVFDPRHYPDELRLRELLLWPFACSRCIGFARCCRLH